MDAFTKSLILSKLDIESKITISKTSGVMQDVLHEYNRYYNCDDGFRKSLLKRAKKYIDMNSYCHRENPNYVCHSGNINMMKIMLRKFSLSSGVNIELNLLPIACGENDLDMIKILCSSSNRFYDFGLNSACLRGKLEALELLISISHEKKEKVNFTKCLYYACHGNQKKIVDYLVSNYGYELDYNEGLQGACESGNIDLVKFILDKGATDLNSGLFGACSTKKNKLIIDYMINIGATECELCDRSMSEHLAMDAKECQQLSEQEKACYTALFV